MFKKTKTTALKVLLFVMVTAGLFAYDPIRDYDPDEVYYCQPHSLLVVQAPVRGQAYTVEYEKSKSWHVEKYGRHIFIYSNDADDRFEVKITDRKQRSVLVRVRSKPRYPEEPTIIRVCVGRFPKARRDGRPRRREAYRYRPGWFEAFRFDNRFSLYGGLSHTKDSGLFVNGELILNAKSKKGLLLQAAGMVDIQKNLRQIGFSAGVGFEPDNLGFFVFADGLSYRFAEYEPTLHLQIRPTLRLRFSKVAGTLFYAFGIGDRYTGVDTFSAPDYTISIYNKALSYFGISLKTLLFERLFIEADAIAASHGAFKIEAKAGYEVVRGLYVSASFQHANFGKYPDLAMHGFGKNTRIGIGVQYDFGKASRKKSLEKRNIVPVFYPLVVSYEKRVEKEKETQRDDKSPKKKDTLSVVLDANPKSGKAPLSVAFEASVSGGTSPYRYEWYFKGDGENPTSGSDSETHTYYENGTYSVYVIVEDAEGNRATSNRVNVEVTQSDKYQIIAAAHDGAAITPEGTILAEPGGDYRFVMSAKDGYRIDYVKVDGKRQGALSEFTFKNVTSDHKIEVWAKRDDGTKQYKITSIANPGGTNSPEGTILVDRGGKLKVLIIPDNGYRVKDVRVDGQSVGAVSEYRFENVNSDHRIESFFENSHFVIEAIQNSGGTISPGGITHVALGGGQTYTITVDAGCQLTDLLVDGRSVGVPSNNTYTFRNVQADHTIEPIFGQQTLTITATAEGGGSIVESGTVKVVYGGSRTFAFVADEGYEPTELRVDGTLVPVPANNSYTFTNVTTNHTIQVKFEKVRYTITVLYNKGGSVTPGTTTVAHGEDITFTINPLDSHKISDVKVDGGSYGELSSYTFKSVKSDHILEVVFAVKTFKITVICDQGSISTPGTTEVIYGENCTFQFTTIEGKYISDVKIDGVSKGEQCSWTFTDIKQDHTIELISQWQTFEISETHDTGGRVFINGTLNPGKVTVKWGEDVTLRFEADKDSGKEIKDVTIDGQSKGIISSYTLKAVKANHTVHLATQWQTFTISETHQTGGIVTLNGKTNPGSVTVRWGESVTCTFKADESVGKEIASVTIDGTNRGKIDSWTFSSVKENHAIDLTTKWIYYTVSETHEVGGQVFINGQLNPGSVQIRWGQAVTFTFDVNSNSGKEIQDVVIDGQSKGVITSFQIADVREDHTCHLALKWLYHTIQVSYGPNGKIVPGTTAVKHGDSITFSITPDPLYMIDQLRIDGTSISPRDYYTFSNVTTNHKIYATFKLKPLPKFDVTYGGYDFEWKDNSLVPNNGSGGGGPEQTIKIEQGQVFEYTYPTSVKDPALPLDKQFDIPFQYVEINGTRSYSRTIGITITRDTYIRAYYYIDRNL